jgi:hypothetical protein
VHLVTLYHSPDQESSHEVYASTPSFGLQQINDDLNDLLLIQGNDDNNTQTTQTTKIAPQSRNILGIVADLSHYNTDASIIDRAVIERTGLSPSQVTDRISQLESLGLVNRQIKVSGADFRLLNITPKGHKELMNS